MFRKIGSAAERAATSVTRRRFLGRAGRGAMAAAMAAAGLLAAASSASAGRNTRICSENSAQLECQGMPYDSPCTAFDGTTGKCRPDNKLRFPDGTYDCNACVPVKGKKREDSPGQSR